MKALSEQQISELEQGGGMGLALAAELNGYPGPTHVLALAKELDLTPEQAQQTRALLGRVKTETIPLGKRIVEMEAALDALFASRRISIPAINAATRKIAATQGELRAAHLLYHIEVAEILTPIQIEGYARLRGYQTPDDK